MIKVPWKKSETSRLLGQEIHVKHPNIFAAGFAEGSNAEVSNAVFT